MSPNPAAASPNIAAGSVPAHDPTTLVRVGQGRSVDDEAAGVGVRPGSAAGRRAGRASGAGRRSRGPARQYAADPVEVTAARGCASVAVVIPVRRVEDDVDHPVPKDDRVAADDAEGDEERLDRDLVVVVQ